MNLTKIKGIGEETAKKFIESGIESIEDLAQFDDPSYFDFTVKQSWLDDAKEITSPPPEPTEPQESPDITDVEPEQETEQPPIDTIAFTLLSGAHQGKAITWKVGDPAMIVGRAGGYVGLSAVNVSEIETVDGVTRFKFVWGQTVSGAELSSDEYVVFSEHVKKNEKPSYDVSVTQNSGIVGRVVQGVQNAAANLFGGCTTGCGG